MSNQMYDVLANRMASKQQELQTRFEYFKSDRCTLSKNTRQTQAYHSMRDKKICLALEHLLRGIDITDDDVTILMSVSKPEEDRVIIQKIEFNVGDRILDVLAKYPDVKNLNKKMNTVCNNKGWKLNFQTGLVELKSSEQPVPAVVEQPVTVELDTLDN